MKSYPAPVRRKPSIAFRFALVASLFYFAVHVVLALFGERPSQYQVIPGFALLAFSSLLVARDNKLAWTEWLRKVDAMKIDEASRQLMGRVRVIGDNGRVLADTTLGGAYWMALTRDGRARKTFIGNETLIVDFIAPDVMDSTTERLAQMAAEAADDPYPCVHPERQPPDDQG